MLCSVMTQFRRALRCDKWRSGVRGTRPLRTPSQTQGDLAMTADEFLERHQWDFCKAFLERADKSGELLRALLLTVGSAGVAFALQQIASSGSRRHIFAAFVFAIGVSIVFWSWDLQKRKAKARFQLMRDKTISDYRNWENGNEIDGIKQQYKSNLWMDRTAACALALGAFIEALILVLR
jgi:hypothetical protein